MENNFENSSKAKQKSEFNNFIKVCTKFELWRHESTMKKETIGFRSNSVKV